MLYDQSFIADWHHWYAKKTSDTKLTTEKPPSLNKEKMHIKNELNAHHVTSQQERAREGRERE